jgi:hypothetical protein
MHEYFEAFSQEGFRSLWEYLAGFSTFFAIAMIALELFVGFMLIIGWKPRLTVGIIWLLTLFFTFLTGYTYLSGYGITKLFLLLSAVAIILLAFIALPEKQNKRNSVAFFSIGFLVLLFLFSKFANNAVLHIKFTSIVIPLKSFSTEFTETQMKVTDCGCFGDFIKLRPWETFYKDCILDVLIAILLLNVKLVRPLFGPAIRFGLATITGLVSLLFCLYNVYMNEPVIDFRPYKIGADIKDEMKVKRAPVIDMTFFYKTKKTGEVKQYTQKELANLNFDELEFVKRKDNVLDPGIPALITNLRIENEDGEITDSLLSDPNYSLMVVAFNLSKTHTEAFKDLNPIAAGCDKQKIKFYTVTVNDGKIDEFRHKYQTAYPFFYADETPLKTMIRSNPGLILLKNGVVINKWHYRHLPTFDQLNQQYFSKN